MPHSEFFIPPVIPTQALQNFRNNATSDFHPDAPRRLAAREVHEIELGIRPRPASPPSQHIIAQTPATTQVYHYFPLDQNPASIQLPQGLTNDVWPGHKRFIVKVWLPHTVNGHPYIAGQHQILDPRVPNTEHRFASPCMFSPGGYNFNHQVQAGREAEDGTNFATALFLKSDRLCRQGYCFMRYLNTYYWVLYQDFRMMDWASLEVEYQQYGIEGRHAQEGTQYYGVLQPGQILPGAQTTAPENHHGRGSFLGQQGPRLPTPGVGAHIGTFVEESQHEHPAPIQAVPHHGRIENCEYQVQPRQSQQQSQPARPINIYSPEPSLRELEREVARQEMILRDLQDSLFWRIHDNVPPGVLSEAISAARLSIGISKEAIERRRREEEQEVNLQYQFRHYAEERFRQGRPVAAFSNGNQAGEDDGEREENHIRSYQHNRSGSDDWEQDWHSGDEVSSLQQQSNSNYYTQNGRPRETLEESECPICLDEFEVENWDAVFWCEQCGKNVHRDCFVEYCRSNEDHMKCVCCRAEVDWLQKNESWEEE